MQRRLLPLIVLITIAMAPVSHGETVASVEQKVREQTARYKTIQLKWSQKFDLESAQVRRKQTIEATLQAAKNGDIWLGRQEIHHKTLDKSADGREEKSEGTTVIVRDGKMVYTLAEVAGRKRATKISDLKQGSPFDVVSQIAAHKKYDSRLMPDQEVNGKACHVVEMTSREPGQVNSLMLVWYQRATGIAVKILSVDPRSGKEVISYLVTEIRIDEEIAPDRFIFKPPVGVELRDLDEERAQTTQSAPASMFGRPQGK